MSPGPDPSNSVSPTPETSTNATRGDGGPNSHQRPQSNPSFGVPNPRNSMSITNTKGLLNMPGQNNCFLNSAVQVLWHLDIFRRSFRELNGHACMAESCIFCALKELFAQFQYSQESALPPDALRRALAETFCDQRRFQLGFMDDAAECFENILLRIHFHIANKESEDMCSASHCIPHQKFAMTLVEQTVCHSCGATSEPLSFTQMVHYVPSSALCSQAKILRGGKKEVEFGELLKRAGGLGDLRDCPSSCGAVIQIRKTLMNRPEIVSIGLVWDSERPTINHITDVFHTIGVTLKLQDVFHSVVDSRWASVANHQLVGIVTYYGKHYSTFFFHTKLRVWIYFDDAAVREIGPKWQQVVEKCCRGHFQPLLLLYANPYGTSVSTSTAPNGVMIVPKSKKVYTRGNFIDDAASNKIRQNLYLQSMESQRRAITPNPEISCDVNANILPRRAITPNGEISHLHLNGMKLEKPPCNSSHKYDSTALTANKSVSQNSWTSKPPNSDNLKIALPKLNDSSSINDVFDDTTDSGSNYISRKAVENVLHQQKLQKQKFVNANNHMCLAQRNSNSSLESLENIYIFQDKGVTNSLGMKFDTNDCMNMPRRRDSGNWSGDRNSASSSSTTSLDNPFFYAMGHKRSYFNGRVIGRPSVADSVTSTDNGYDSFSLSSSDSYPSIITLPYGKGDSRLGQIVENQQTAFLPFDISHLEHSIHHLNRSENQNFVFRDECEKLCIEADIFLAKSVERENIGDLSMAALLSDSAAAKARAAMDVPYSFSHSLSLAKLKHSMCLIRSCNLRKKLKEVLKTMEWKQKHSEILKNKDASQNLKQSELKYSKSNSTADKFKSLYSKNQIIPDANHKIPKNVSDSTGKSIEIYATLPKKSLRKNGGLLAFVDSFAGDDSALEKSKHKSDYDEIVSKMPNLTTCSNVNTSTNCPNQSHINLKRSPERKPMGQTNLKSFSKDSDLSDYSSELESSQKSSLHRTYSSPPMHSKGLSGESTDDGQGCSGQYPKKQHKIRRKLMGGFMKRKNRSLPDLREGQDQTKNEISRSFDDCSLTRATKCSNPCDKEQEQNHCDTSEKNKLLSLDVYNGEQTVNGALYNDRRNFCICSCTCRPEKTLKNENPNCIGNSCAMYSSSHLNTPGFNDLSKGNIALCHTYSYKKQHGADTQCSKQNISSCFGHRQFPKQTFSGKDKLYAEHIPLSNVTKQNPLPYKHMANQELPKGCAIWLKELRMKQEELLLKKKLQEAKHSNDKTDSISPKSKIEESQRNKNELLPSRHVINNGEVFSVPSQRREDVTSDDGSQSSVKYLASKFEKISKPMEEDASPDAEVRELDRVAVESHSGKDVLLQSAQMSMKNDVDYNTRLASSFSNICAYSPVMQHKNKVASKQTETNCMTINGEHACLPGAKHSSPNFSTTAFKSMPLQLNCRRPNKPPDYETALQRLEFIRGDKSFMKQFSLHHLPILESYDKKKSPSKKSVTFSDKVVLVACAEEDHEFLPNPLIEQVYKQHFLQKVPADNANSNNEEENESVTSVFQQIDDHAKNCKTVKNDCMQSPCNLCHKRNVSIPNIYCSDCAFYMSKFQS